MKGPRDTFDIHAKNFPGANGTLAKTHGVYPASVKNKCDLNLSFFFFFYHTIDAPWFMKKKFLLLPCFVEIGACSGGVRPRDKTG